MSKIVSMLLAALVAAPLMAQSTPKPAAAEKSEQAETKTAESAAKPKGDKPAASPGWLIVEEDFWFPLRFEPYYALDSIRYHYRRDEEKAAANQIDKAVSWLRLAAGHALPVTKKKLTAASTELTTLAKALRKGDIASAASLNTALANAAHALGEWHFYKAKETWGKGETATAGRDLEMAAQYLQHAANSAHYQYGPDTTKVITTLYENGKFKEARTTYDHNALGKHLQEVEVAVKALSDAMKKK